jgi:flagellar hook assembly protein FlgD
MDPKGGTPGAKNSVDEHQNLSQASVTAEPNPFSPDGDGYEDRISIHVRVPTNAATLSILLFDSVGRLVRTLVSASPIAGHCGVEWDGTNDEGKYCRTGLYILLFEASDAFNGSTIRGKKALILVKKQ